MFANGRAWGIAAAALCSVLVRPAAAETDMRFGAEAFRLQITSYRDIPFRTVVRQQFDYSCGSAALATLLRFHYGRDVHEAELFEAMYRAGNQEQIRKVGFSLLDMKRYLDEHGLPSDGFRMTLDELAKESVPAITVITLGSYKHFVVVKGVSGNKVLIGDPALGLKIYSRDEFEKLWGGIVFMIRKQAGREGSFNVASEWQPWSRTPLGQPLDSASLFGIGTNTPPLYQVTQLGPQSN